MKSHIKDFILICFGTLIMTLGLSYFLIPNNIAVGGASGVATILHAKFGFHVSVVVLIINAILFFISFKTMPKSVFVKSAIGTVALTMFLELTANVMPFTNDILLASSFGGVLVGFGVGVVVRYGASTGGSDFLAIILHSIFKKRISVAKLILMIDGFIIFTAGILFNDYTLMLYTVISAFISSKITDTIVEGGNSAKSVYIISDKSEQIGKEVMKVLERGSTGIYGKGMYTNKDITLLLCIVKRNEIPKLRAIVNKVDDKAFIILSEVREVLGKGF